MCDSRGLFLTVYPDFDNAPYSGLSCHKNMRKKKKEMNGPPNRQLQKPAIKC